MTMFDQSTRAVRVSDARANDVEFRATMNNEWPRAAGAGAGSADGGDYERGVANARLTIEAEFEAERLAMLQLIDSTVALQDEPSEEIASLIAETVLRVVSEIVGSVPVDRELLMRRVVDAVAIISECDAARTIRVHPDDVPLLDDEAIRLTIIPDPEAERGSIRIDCSAGWIEHGTSNYLDALRSVLGQGGTH